MMKVVSLLLVFSLFSVSTGEDLKEILGYQDDLSKTLAGNGNLHFPPNIEEFVWFEVDYLALRSGKREFQIS